MKRFRQEFEMETTCKKVGTAFKRFAKRYPKAWEVWGEVFEGMYEQGLEHTGERDETYGGWSLWLYVEDNEVYMAIVLTDEGQQL